jgi:hypothetical protein
MGDAESGARLLLPGKWPDSQTLQLVPGSI